MKLTRHLMENTYLANRVKSISCSRIKLVEVTINAIHQFSIKHHMYKRKINNEEIGNHHIAVGNGHSIRGPSRYAGG